MRSSALTRCARRLIGVASIAVALAIPATSLDMPVANAATRAPTPAARVLSIGQPEGIKPIHGLRSSLARPGRIEGASTLQQIYLHSTATEGVIAVHPKVYLVFWGSQWSSDPAGAKSALQAFFKGLYGSDDTWGPVLDQYCQGLAVNTTTCGSSGTHISHPTSSILGGVWSDNGSAEPAAATSTQLADEAAAAASHFGNTTQSSNLNAQYVIASPTGTDPDNYKTSNFCAWHSSASTTDGTIAYTNLPYLPDQGVGVCTTINNPTILDGYFSTETHEYAETITDLWPSNGWLDSSGSEVADKCVDLDGREKLSTGTFDVQGIWSNSDENCVFSSKAIWSSQSTVPSALTAGSPALTYLNGNLWAVWQGQTGPDFTLWYSEYNGSGWSAQAQIKGTWGSALTTGPPAVSGYLGSIYVAWTSTSNEIDVSILSGGTWSAPATVSGSWGTAKTDHGPSLGNYDNSILFATWKGNGSTSVWYSTLSGSSTTWAGQSKVPGASTPDTPAVIGSPTSTIFAGTFAWTTSTGTIKTSAVSGLGFGVTETVPHAVTPEGPALAMVNGDLFFAWKGNRSNTQVWFSDAINYKAKSDTWAPQRTQPQAGTDDRPAIAAWGSTLAAAWRGTTGDGVFYSLSTNPY